MIWSHVRTAAIAAVVFTAAVPRLAEATPFNFTFDVDAQSFQGTSSNGPRPITFLSSGGNPGGFITVGQDAIGVPGSGTVTSTVGVFRSIGATSYGGTLTFDTRVVDQSTTIFNTSLLNLSLTGTSNGTPFVLNL